MNDPPVIVPVDGSITAPSVGAWSKLKVPPPTPRTVAVAPSQVGVNSNDESSCCKLVTSTTEADGQASFVV